MAPAGVRLGGRTRPIRPLSVRQDVDLRVVRVERRELVAAMNGGVVFGLLPRLMNDSHAGRPGECEERFRSLLVESASATMLPRDPPAPSD